MAPSVDGFPEEKAKGMVFGDALLSEATQFAANIQPAEKSAVQVVVIPDNFFDYYMPRFERCRSDLYMEAFDGQRYMHTIQTEDFGMAFMTDLFKCNPRILKSLIAVCDTSMTMEMRSAAMLKNPKYERTSGGQPKPLQMAHGGKMGNGFAAENGVRALIHKFVTKPHCGVMKWHIDDFVNSAADGSYRMASMMLPATRKQSDAICTEISGCDFKVPHGTGVWLPCNVLHRGIPTLDEPREVLMVEFIAAGRQHTNAGPHYHEDVKDWLYFSKNTLLEHMRTPGPRTCSYMV
jgi:hypothetical protein